MRHFIVYTVKYGSCLVFGLNLPLPLLNTQSIILIVTMAAYGLMCYEEAKLKYAK